MDLKKTVAEEIAKNRANGFRWSPPMKDEAQCEMVILTFLEAFVKVGYTDADAPRLAKAFLTCRTSQQDWPTPAMIIETVRSIPKRYDRAKELPAPTSEEAANNLRRLNKMISDAGFTAIRERAKAE